jgi:hypothetical protein
MEAFLQYLMSEESATPVAMILRLKKKLTSPQSTTGSEAMDCKRRNITDDVVHTTNSVICAVIVEEFVMVKLIHDTEI